MTPVTPLPTEPAALNPLDPDPPPAAVVREHWGVFLAFGVVQILGGVFALGMAAVTTSLALLVLGAVALTAGVAQFFSAFWAADGREGLARVLVGLLYGAFGVVVLANPAVAGATFTLLLAVLLLVSGAVRAGAAAAARYRGWGWELVGGAVAALLGGLIWADWPENSAWVIGLFVGIDLLVMGWYWVALALAARRPEPRGTAAYTPA